MATKENLQAAFAGESQANRKYLAFAKKAEQDGLPQVARLFRAAAEAETVHAHAHLRALGGIQSTIENLKSAVAGEAYEVSTMYPPFVEQAEKEGHRPGATSFKNALAVEKTHYRLYTEALEAVQAGRDLPVQPIHVCTVCGETVIGELPEKCPVCQANRKSFQSIG